MKELTAGRLMRLFQQRVREHFEGCLCPDCHPDAMPVDMEEWKKKVQAMDNLDNPLPCTPEEVIESVLGYFLQHGHGITFSQIAELEALETAEVIAVFSDDQNSPLLSSLLDGTDGFVVSDDTVWEPSKNLLAKIAARHLDGWSSRRIRELIKSAV